MKVLICGYNSWISQALNAYLRDEELYFTSRYVEKKNVYSLKNSHEYNQFLEDKNLNFDVVINCLRGENLDGEKINKSIIRYCERKKAKYIYLSSSWVYENTPSFSRTESSVLTPLENYGKFKKLCESQILNSSINSIILRLPSLHSTNFGESRTTKFLKKINKEVIYCDRGIIQNRYSMELLCKIIKKIIIDDICGTFNIGTVDTMEEYIFLENIISYKKSKCNIYNGELKKFDISMNVELFIDVFGGEFILTNEKLIEEICK